MPETIQMDYLDDMSKYQESANEIKKTRLTYGTIAVQLSRKNTRFQYKIIKLLKQGVSEDHILTYELDLAKDIRFRNPFELAAIVLFGTQFL